MKQFSFMIVATVLILGGGVLLETPVTSSHLDPSRDWRDGRMIIHQASSYSVVSLHEYPPEGVKVIAPGPEAITIFRVTSGNPTELYGKLKANGKVIVVNPAGVLVGAAARFDLGEGRLRLSLDDNKAISEPVDFSGDAPYWNRDSTNSPRMMNGSETAGMPLLLEAN